MSTQPADLTPEESEHLERLIDRRGIDSVLMAISEICGQKAQHIDENWQDVILAKRWAMLEGQIGCVVPQAIGL